MNIQEMHYYFKLQLNKLDSEQYRNLLIPEIDFILNQATEMFIKMTAFPRYNPIPGFEKTQRDREDIRNIVVDDYVIQPVKNNETEYIYQLPIDYLYYISSRIIISNNICNSVKAKLLIKQHDDNFRESPFDKSSFEWREVNAIFFDKGIKAFADFELKELSLDYIKQYPYLHYAEGYNNGQYTDLKGNILTGTQDCILSAHTHSEIIDIAVLLATQFLQIPDYQIKLNKLKLT